MSVSPSPTISQPLPASRTQVRVVSALAAVTLLLALGQLGFAAALVVDTNRSEGSLAGVGYIVAGLLAAVAAPAAGLAVAALARRRRGGSGTQALAAVGLALVLAPLWVLGAGAGLW